MKEPPQLYSDYILTRISALVERKVVYASGSEWRGDLLAWYRRIFWIWVDFFQRNGLTTRVLAEAESDIGIDFVVRVGDLTNEGLEMYRAVEERWYRALDRRDENGQRAFLARGDTAILERRLHEIRRRQSDVPTRVASA